ncbi:putative short-chain type dehydrogenase reductase y4eK [Hyphodiscus hymeniophilus]|uniref:Short-chain type dehydrogenase reductase y4eK n=1 Tax=Hyphodiscus hymeniophilus TaxID=353542 RepID=A0A9P6SNI9_9HELO|nr:putative short-chain type dehydrogenase reductase y4eK [Hyphodiscus hymeniophilus]
MAGIFNVLIAMLAGLGAVTLCCIIYSMLRFLTLHLIIPSHPLQSYKRSGPEPTYALVTGSSAGIGLGVAQALVKEGFAIILLGHLAEELAEAKSGLQALRPGAVVRILVMNARTATPEEIKDAVQSIADLQLSILVNNVGGNPVRLPAFRPMATHSSEDIDAVINHNARFMARLTALTLPLLSRNSRPEDRSLILNMSSAAWVGIPWIIMYGATKAFNLGFSCGLARELKASPDTSHIDCLAIVPGEVRSQGNCEGVSDSEPRWDQFGQCIVDKADNAISRNQTHLHPWMMHDFQQKILAALPEGISTAALNDALGKKREAFNSAWERSQKME